ncbi:MAG: hypothetical protein ACR2F1_13400 [Nitrososphaeraceae archaeon]
MKHLGSLDHQNSENDTEHSKKRENILIEIHPKFFSIWDYGNAPS